MFGLYFTLVRRQVHLECHFFSVCNFLSHGLLALFVDSLLTGRGDLHIAVNIWDILGGRVGGDTASREAEPTHIARRATLLGWKSVH